MAERKTPPNELLRQRARQRALRELERLHRADFRALFSAEQVKARGEKAAS